MFVIAMQADSSSRDATWLLEINPESKKNYMESLPQTFVHICSIHVSIK